MFVSDLPPPRRGIGSTAALLFLASTVLAACSESPSAGIPLGPGESGASLYIEPPPRDPGIDPGDTHYSIDVVLEGSTTITSPVAITDPVTGATTYEWTVQHEPETLRVDVGYDAYGREVQDLRQTGTIDDPTVRPVNTTRRTTSVADYLTRYDAYGGVVPNDPGVVQPYAAPTPPSHEQITDGVVLNADEVDALNTLSATAEPLARVAGPRARVVRAGPDRIRIVNDLAGGPAPPGAATAGVQSMQPERGQYTRTYRRRGQKYLLEETELTAEYTGKDNASTRMRQIERIRFVRLQENPHKDRQRREVRAQLGISDISTQSFDWAVEPNKLCPPDEPPTSSCTPYEPPPPPPPAPDPCPPVTGGTNVLFQHGIMSDGGTWWRMDREWVRCRLQTNQIERPSINWRPAIDKQRDELRGKVPADMQQIVMIGHSNGGLVSRSYAQWAQASQPGRVKGVVTLDSPNQGAIVARNAKALEYVIGSASLGLGWILVDFLFYHPFYEDDVPGSPYLNRTNSFSEGFTRVGIQTHAPKRWVGWRVVLSATRPPECTPESNCGERAIARQTQESYDRARHYSKFWYRPWQSIPAGVKMAGMNGLDAVWNGLTAPSGLPTDGFIHGPGQVYPRALRNRLILNGDSHVGTTRSPYVWTELKISLEDRNLFGLLPR